MSSCPSIRVPKLHLGGNRPPDSACWNHQQRRLHIGGFTLIELLVVMTVIVLLVTASMSILPSFLAARGVTKQIYDTAELLEFARDEAVARQTYVWVGFQNLTNSGSAEVRMAVVGSLDGTATNIQASNLVNLGKTLRLQNATLTSWSSLKPATRASAANIFPSPITPDSAATNTAGIPFQVGTTFATVNDSITFTPRGEAMLAGKVTLATGYNPYIDVSLQQTHGTITAPNADDGSVVIDGATGAAQVIQLQ